MANYITTDTELTSVADAIRAKGGTSAPLAFPDGFVSAVDAIPTGGGGGGSIPAKEVNFRDYDGTVVYAYTPAEFAALTAMPDNPDHSGDAIPLTSQGWNWTLAEVREQLAAIPEQTVWVGQMYVPTDGKTHIKIYIPPDTPESKRDMNLRFSQSTAYGVKVDWGDGSATETYNGTNAQVHAHTYTDTGWFIITLEATSGTIDFSGTNGKSGYSIYGQRSTKFSYRRGRIREVRFGNGVTSIGDYAFDSCYNLATVTMRLGMLATGQYAFDYCYKLQSITIPSAFRTIGNYTFGYCYTLQRVSTPKVIQNSIGNSVMSNCYANETPIIRDGRTAINQNEYYGNYSLTTITVPASVTSIGASAFYNCYSIVEYHIKPTTPPTLADTQTFYSIHSDCKFYVPYSEDHSILAAYQAASYWNTYASRMVEEAE